MIINHGTLVFEGTTRKLLEHSHDELVVVPDRTEDLSRLAALLDDAEIEFIANGTKLRAPKASSQAALINRLAFNNEITLRELRSDVEDLEDMFLRLTNARKANRHAAHLGRDWCRINCSCWASLPPNDGQPRLS